MKLIATLGTTLAKYMHTYKLDSKSYQKRFSFEAIKEHYQIKDEDVYIIGTKDTKEKQCDYISKYHFIKIDADDLDDIFAKATKIISKDAIVDLTQSFRSVSFGVILSMGFSKTLGKQSKEIYYAQTDSAESNPSETPCKYKFISLKRYDEIGDLSRTINTFLHTLIVIDNNVLDEKFQKLYKQLQKISKNFFNNNYEELFKSAEIISETLNLYKDDVDFDYLKEHIERLILEIKKIKKLKNKFESQMLLNCSKYLLTKGINLHAITTLYESMTAFLDEEISPSECNKILDKRRGKMRKANTYERRNCLKKSLKQCNKVKQIIDCNTFSKHLRNIDKLRNISAHAFTSDNTYKNFSSEIRKTIDFLENYYPNRLSQKNSIDKLKSIFQ